MNYKRDFPSLKKATYFDNAATTQTPKQVVKAITDFYSNYKANIHRGVYDWSIKASDEYEFARETVAKFINAKPEEIIFTKNATESINMIANLLGKKFKTGEVINSYAEHHSNFLPWLEQKHLKKVFVDLDKDFKYDLNDLENKINGKTKVVALSHVSNVLGVENNLKKISDVCKNKFLVVDGAQSAPHVKIDVKKNNVDVFSFSGHKMLGPTGIGVIYVKEDLLKTLGTYQVGGGTIADVTLKSAKYAKYPSRYEAGTPNIAGAIGLKAAIKYLSKIGLDNIRDHEKNLSKELMLGLKNMDANIIGDTLKDKLGVVSFNLDGMSANDLAMQLSDKKIYVRSGHHCTIPLHKHFKVNNSLRASLYLYNTKKEVKSFLEILGNI